MPALTVYQEETGMRPYIICHVISSIDGRISGKSFELPEMGTVHDANFALRRTFGCDGILNGTVTCAEIYSHGYLETEYSDDGRRFYDRIYRAPHEEDCHVVCIDPEGRLDWRSNKVARDVMPVSHVIAVVTEATPASYIQHLRDTGLSYIVAGEKDADLVLAAELLGEYGIKRLLVTGGGAINYSLLACGLADEISVVVAPIVVGEKDKSSSFDKSPFSKELESRKYRLLSVKELAEGSVHLRYGL